jgi:hypothetical protein
MTIPGRGPGRTAPTPPQPRRSRRLAGRPALNSHIIGDEWVTKIRNPSSMFGRVRKLDPSDIFLLTMDWDAPFHHEYATFNLLEDLFTDPDDNEVDWSHPFAMSAKANNDDEPNLRDIHNMSSTEQEAWYDAMELEIAALLEKGAFREIDASNVPSGSQIVPSTWIFKRKRRPDGLISKLKARFCVRGDRQRLDLDESVYAPVVDWGTVRLMFTLTVAHGLATRQIDFANAFVQSTLPKPVYLAMPPGFTHEGKVYEVTRSLYGDRRAPKLWFNHLRQALVDEMGFTQSIIDPCLFLKDNIAFVNYVDDGIFIAKNDSDISKEMAHLAKLSFDFSEEDDYAGYLGVQIKRSPTDGSMELTQTGLINRILADLDLTDSPRIKDTPAEDTLGSDPTLGPMTEDFNYRSVLGKLLYLSNNTRSDISMANHQCARFSNNTKSSHAAALKHIGRYLLKTKDKGMIIRPSKDLSLNCYADADFAGLFKREVHDDPRSTRSRTGFVITLGDIPVVWVSRLQTETALSTMEAEYVALSTAMRSLIPMRIILGEANSALNLSGNKTSVIRSTIWEDNQAALILATSDPPRLTPRSKHIAVKYHWFREHLKKGVIEIKAVSSELQWADILTKPMKRVQFEAARKHLLGW